MYRNSRQSWILDSTPWIPDSQELDSSYCQWDLDSGFQSSEGLRIPWAAIPGFPSSKHLLDFGIRIPLKLSFLTICTVHTICKLFDWFSRLACLFQTTSFSLVVHSLCCLPLLPTFPVYPTSPLPCQASQRSFLISAQCFLPCWRLL